MPALNGEKKLVAILATVAPGAIMTLIPHISFCVTLILQLVRRMTQVYLDIVTNTVHCVQARTG